MSAMPVRRTDPAHPAGARPASAAFVAVSSGEDIRLSDCGRRSYPRLCHRRPVGAAMSALPETLDAPRRSAAPAAGWLWAVARNAVPFLVLGALWEIAAHLGLFPAKLFPPLETIAVALYRLTISGILPVHVVET